MYSSLMVHRVSKFNISYILDYNTIIYLCNILILKSPSVGLIGSPHGAARWCKTIMYFRSMCKIISDDVIPIELHLLKLNLKIL